ncbi:MAG: esterase, partial [Verrucomicrobiae bacterium]|nr:esterase [Verrucomicrobiae bacterium]
LTGNFSPEKPVSVLAIQGTEDPLVPYDGGEVKLLGMARGRVIGTREVLKLWIDRDRCNAHPSVSTLPDRDPQDGCRAELSIYGGGDEGSEVRLIRVEGGGHTWPGGRQYAGKWLIGTVCRDFDATQEIWNFFKTHRRATRAESE